MLLIYITIHSVNRFYNNQKEISEGVQTHSLKTLTNQDFFQKKGFTFNV